MRKIPSVLTWHNDLPDVTSGAGILVKVNKSVSAVYLNSFDRIIATTKAYANSSTILRRYPKKVKVIHNGVDTRRFSPTVDGSFIREKYGLEGKTVALFVGALTRWHEYKGVDVPHKSIRHAVQKTGRSEITHRRRRQHAKKL